MRYTGGRMRGVGTVIGVLVVLAGSRLGAQQSDSAAAARYRAQRADALRAIAQDEQRLADLRRQRLALESRVDSAAAGSSEARAHTLLMSGDVAALRSLDSLLSASQRELLGDRDRFLALASAVRQRDAGTLVVLIAADRAGGAAAAAAAVLDSGRGSVDSAPAGMRRYSSLADSALAAGGADQVYRSNVLPGAHVVAVMASVGGSPAAESAAVTVTSNTVTYVEFTWRDGKWVEATWTNGALAP
jgi:type II secretory pathway component PulL